MATIFRPPYFFAAWRRDPAGIAIRAQSEVAGANRNLNLLKGKDTFFGPPGLAPDYDWPNPTLPKSRTVASVFSQDAVTQNRSPTLLKGKDTFFGPPGLAPDYDWPNPTLPKSRTVASVFSQDAVTQNRSPTLLKGKDTFFGPPGLGPDYDWPNPIQRVFAAARAIFSQSDVWQNALGTLLAVTIAAAPFSAEADPNPRGAVNRIALTLDSPNLLATTLAGQDAIYGGPGQVPSYDWPNPVLPRSRAQAFDPPNIAGALQQPFAQSDWPNPNREPSRIVAILSPPDRQPLPLGTLSGQDQIYGGPGQVPAYDWPNPAKGAARPVLEPPNLLGTVLAPAEVPFSQDGWPLPWGAVNRVALAGDPPNLLGTLLATPVVTGTPFTQADWPNPRGASRSPLTFDPADLLGTLLKPASSAVILRPPLVFRNWSLSGEVARLPAAPPNLLVTTFVPPVPLPFNQSDWPNPRGAAQPDRPDPPNLQGTTLSGLIAPPFFQTEWPNPVLATSRLVAITAPPPRPLLLGELAGQDQFFGAPGQVPAFDWPNPRGPILRALVADPTNLLGTTLGPVVAPFYQTEWPNSLGRRQATTFDFPCPLALNSAAAAVPFSQDEWPNPPRPRRPVQEQSASTLALYNTVAFSPFAFLGWTVPRGAKLNQPQAQPPNIVLNAPTPPTLTDTPWSGFTANMGRLMGRRG